MRPCCPTLLSRAVVLFRVDLRRSWTRKSLSLPRFWRDKQCHFDGEKAAPLSPKDFNNIAQGRAAHPGLCFEQSHAP